MCTSQSDALLFEGGGAGACKPYDGRAWNLPAEAKQDHPGAGAGIGL